MDNILMTLGDTFYVLEYDDTYGRNKRIDYVYLYDIGDITFCAKILNKSLSNSVVCSHRKVINNPKSKQRDNNPAYCFVELSTKEYKGRIVHLYKTDENPIRDNINPYIRLSEEEIEEIKKEILEKRIHMKPVLVEYVESLN